MNYVTANILAYTQHAELRSPKIMGNQRTMDVIVNEESWPFDEVTAFYILVFIMEDKGWREIIRPGIPGLMVLLETIEQCLSQDFPQVVEHLQNELQLEQNDLMTFLFTDNIISLFISKLKEVCPLQLIQFWDIFLIQGDQAIVKLIMKSFELYQDEILQLEEEEVI